VFFNAITTATLITGHRVPRCRCTANWRVS